MAETRTFQDMLLALQAFWHKQGCFLAQPYPSEVGAGTFNPATFLRALGPEPWKVAYVEPSRRPKDGRYGENPNRLQNFYQYQVLLKPVPENIVALYEESLEAMGIDLKQHDLRYVVDDWESPTLGAWGLGWEVWLDGMEVTQFTYFQQVGSIDLNPLSVEITYGIERIATYLQSKDRIMDLQVTDEYSWADLNLETEKEFCAFNFEEANVEQHFHAFTSFEAEAKRLLEKDLVAPGYDFVIKASHMFNMLEARGAISVTERTGYIGRVRNLARMAARAYVRQRERLGFPMIKDEAKRLEAVAAAEAAQVKANKKKNKGSKSSKKKESA
ncbi:MAG: glycine--tRNA ligase subunit alpha [Candidatus Eisenbacteria bacterium]|uniref:Glycine--tRNA ligase alpha subunit n=1 Tax=Eiseniibacteriota bacterium TaxID=2212470 RepID=A0A7Y2H3D6_UNCEI|nr:glycine--tRNA ligase subunit alpha [Candidatus Eisenbacteria bacterium]